MKAAVVTGFEAPMQLENLTLRAPAPHEVTVRIEAAAMCITDAEQARGRLGTTPPPFIVGHSAVATVQELGPGVTRMKAGDRVIIPATSECGTCYFCSRGRSDQCEQHLVPARDTARRRDGTAVSAAFGTAAVFATHANLREISAFPVETNLPAEHLAMFGCGIGTGLGAVFNVAQVQPGSSVVVTGAGHLGLWMVQGARIAGAGRIICVDPDSLRRRTAVQMGATHAVDPDEADPVEQVLALTAGRGADYSLEAAGPPEAVLQAFHMARNAGTVVVSGVRNQDDEVRLPALKMAVRGRSIHSVQNGNLRMTRDLERFVRLMEAGHLDPSSMVTNIYSLEDINDAAQAALERKNLTGIIVP